MHLAVHNGYDRVVEWLIKNGADPQIGNHLGDTALSFAVQGALSAYNKNIAVAAQEEKFQGFIKKDYKNLVL